MTINITQRLIVCFFGFVNREREKNRFWPKAEWTRMNERVNYTYLSTCCMRALICFVLFELLLLLCGGSFVPLFFAFINYLGWFVQSHNVNWIGYVIKRCGFFDTIPIYSTSNIRITRCWWMCRCVEHCIMCTLWSCRSVCVCVCTRVADIT